MIDVPLAVGAVARLAVGGVFVLSGLVKILELATFAAGVVQYQVLPPPVARGVGYALPWIEVLVGLLLLLGLFAGPAGAVAGFLLLTFAAAVLVNLLRGRRDLPCYCFGAHGGGRIGVGTLARQGALGLMLLLAAVWDQGSLLTAQWLASVAHERSQVLPVVLVWLGLFTGSLILGQGVLFRRTVRAALAAADGWGPRAAGADADGGRSRGQGRERRPGEG